MYFIIKSHFFLCVFRIFFLLSNINALKENPPFDLPRHNSHATGDFIAAFHSLKVFGRTERCQTKWHADTRRAKKRTREKKNIHENSRPASSDKHLDNDTNNNKENKISKKMTQSFKLEMMYIIHGFNLMRARRCGGGGQIISM